MAWGLHFMLQVKSAAAARHTARWALGLIEDGKLEDKYLHACKRAKVSA